MGKSVNVAFPKAIVSFAHTLSQMCTPTARAVSLVSPPASVTSRLSEAVVDKVGS